LAGTSAMLYLVYLEAVYWHGTLE